VRIGVVDIGTNSTRLLVADVDPDHGSVQELDRRSTVTRLGQGVDRTGALAPEAMDRVNAALDEYTEVMDRLGVEARPTVLTSAVRDASNGGAFTSRVVDGHGLEARNISGDEEAQLTFLGATSERPDSAPGPVVVIDIGGGSTEFVTDEFHVSTQAGVVRHSERHIVHDPPQPEELDALRQDVRAVFDGAIPAPERERVNAAVAVAGTATSCAAIAQELDPYDPARVHGYVLDIPTLEGILGRLAQMTNDQRREVRGLHPDRAPTIVAGVLMLIEALRTFELETVEVSEHDILRGVALRRAGAA
jgi:exopolyphosphatase/guanosine-5'-triphosphate,3'-diphosphate pyrophosphatase